MQLSTALRIRPGEVVALVGGGGKTTTMFRLGRELVSAGRRVLLTTTTRIFASQIDLAPAVVYVDDYGEDPQRLLPQLDQAIDRHGQVLLVGRVDPASNKAAGLAPETIDALANSGRFEAIINEADGSRMRPFKAPADHEPVIPTTTSLVIPVVGLDVLGAPLNDESVHRATLVARLSGLATGAPITTRTVTAVLTHAQGGLKGVPSTARVIPLLNKLDRVDETVAKDLAHSLLQHERIDTVAVGAAGQKEGVLWVESRVAAVVLAAGGSDRFGSPKQVALWQGKPLLAHVVDAALASPAGPVIVVLGAHAEACRAALGERPVEIVVNPDWPAGQSTSLKAGLAAIPASVGAALFPLADQPFISSAVFDALIDNYQRTLAPVVWPTFAGQRGNPVLFDRALFAEMTRISGDVGARPVIQAHREQAVQVPVPEPGILRDIDRPEDLE